jgi:hypothetical protein
MEPRGFGWTLFGTIGIAVVGAVVTLFIFLVIQAPITCEDEGELGRIVVTGGLVLTALAIGLWVRLRRQMSAILLNALIGLSVFGIVYQLPLIFIALHCTE